MLSVLIFFPLLASVAALFAGENAKRLALIAALFEFALSVWMAIGFQPSGGAQFLQDYWWISSLGISYKVGIDGISFFPKL